MKATQKISLMLLLSLLSVGNIYGSEVLKKEITFFVDHTTKNVTGVCTEVNIDSVNLQLTGKSYSLKSPFQITIPLMKIESGDDGRDSHIREILGYPEFSNVIVKIESVTPEAEGYSVKGKLTIHGKTKDFSSAAKVDATDPNVILVDGKVIAKFSEYELENPSLLFMKAKDNIEIKYVFQIKVK
jgi:polyisoprenoid-binding protein YceI